MVAGERQIAKVGGDTGNEAQHTDEQDDDTNVGGCLLHVCAGRPDAQTMSSLRIPPPGGVWPPKIRVARVAASDC
jgi:hypothetical protein